MRIDLLGRAEASAVTTLLREIDRSLFDGLTLDPRALAEQFAAVHRDRYWGVWEGNHLQAIFFLRGLDAGYAAPAFGVAVASAAQGRGLGRLALLFAETWSRGAGLPEIMLTVGALNQRAIALYETQGFVHSGERSTKGNLIYRKSLRA